MSHRGFTLLELLIVMAVLGILAVVVFTLINPSEMLARSRDTGRINAVNQLGRSVQHYRTTHDNSYPPETSWGTALTGSAEINIVPSGIDYSVSGTSPCTTNVLPSTSPTYCYDLDEINDYGAIVFARLESTQKHSLCVNPETPYTVFSTEDSRGGTICSQDEPTPWASGTMSYVQ